MDEDRHERAPERLSGEHGTGARAGQWLRGKWRLDALLGTGGMAAVYAATHRNGRRGAVKILHPAMAADDEVRARFLREGYVANKVDHPAAVAVLDDDQTDDGTTFLVMELLDGQTVQARADARASGRLALREVAVIVDRLLDVLCSAHGKGIIHRDLKPDNLFLTSAGEPKVLDFGIARVRESAGTLAATKTGSIYGTPAFMPPEQARGLRSEVDARSDLWAVGATAFVLLTGRTVHVEARSINELLLAAMTEPAPPIGALVRLPAAVEQVFDRALAFAAADRWPDARSMQSALREAYRAAFGEPIPARIDDSLVAQSEADVVHTARPPADGATQPMWREVHRPQSGAPAEPARTDEQPRLRAEHTTARAPRWLVMALLIAATSLVFALATLHHDKPEPAAHAADTVVARRQPEPTALVVPSQVAPATTVDAAVFMESPDEVAKDVTPAKLPLRPRGRRRGGQPVAPRDAHEFVPPALER